MATITETRPLRRCTWCRKDLDGTPCVDERARYTGFALGMLRIQPTCEVCHRDACYDSNDTPVVCPPMEALS